MGINTEIVEYIQKGKNLYLKEDSDGNKMLNYLCKKDIEVDFYGKENQLKEAILNLGKEETI